MSKSRALNILLVEDDDDHAGLFSEFLSAGVILWGAGRVTRVHNLAEAEAYLRDAPVDVIILDLGLPDSDGLDTLRAVLRVADQQAIVVLTAQNNSALGLTSIEMGAQDFLVKGDITEGMISRAVRYAHERKQSLLALAERNLDLETYRRVISNDMRSPLRKIKFISDTLQSEAGTQMSPEHLGYLQRLPVLCDEMRALVNGLEAFVKAGSVMDESVIPLTQLVEEVRSSLPEEDRGRLHVEAMPQVLGDPLLLRDVFKQLIVNGLKFSAGGDPEIRVTATRADDVVTVSVSDNGTGIDPLILNRIFQPGIRERSRDDELGAGLGLSICARIVHSHGGRIWVNATSDAGSEFRFTLPAAEQ